MRKISEWNFELENCELPDPGSNAGKLYLGDQILTVKTLNLTVKYIIKNKKQFTTKTYSGRVIYFSTNLASVNPADGLSETLISAGGITSAACQAPPRRWGMRGINVWGWGSGERWRRAQGCLMFGQANEEEEGEEERRNEEEGGSSSQAV